MVILSEIVVKMSEILENGKTKGKTKTKSGIIGPRLHLNSVFQLALTVNPRSVRENKRHETSHMYVVYTKP